MSWPISYGNLLYKMDQDVADMQYTKTLKPPCSQTILLSMPCKKELQRLWYCVAYILYMVLILEGISEKRCARKEQSLLIDLLEAIF